MSIDKVTIREPEKGVDSEPHSVDLSTASDLGIPAEWIPLISAGCTMVRHQGPTETSTFPYEVDFVWPNDIRFTFFGAEATYRAMYILRPRLASVWALGNSIFGSWSITLIVGVAPGKPGYKMIKMEYVTFVDK